jgi:hypothetical protein
VVDVGRTSVTLRSRLQQQQRLAELARERPVLWLVVPECSPCDGVAASLRDPLMQRALGSVRLIRLDVREHLFELKHLSVPVEKIPGFAMLGQDGVPIDYIHGGEWDDDIARTIAPVLGKFVRGEFTQRRDPWRGGERDDETAM